MTLARVVFLGVLAVSSAFLVSGAGVLDAAAGGATDGGDVVVVEANAAGRELDGGGSGTPYSLRLPDGASCPGDTRNDQWAFQTFMIPADIDPASLEFSDAGPTGPFQFALYAETTQPLTDEILVPNAEPGLPGLIPPIPPLTFSVFPPGELEGSYRIGVACTFLREPSIFWDASIVIDVDADDEPGQFSWRTEGSPVAQPSDGSSSLPIVAAAIGVGVLGVAGVTLRRRSRPSTSTKEHVA
jgi:hypothetical protein